jgi:hypothetical protein
LLNYYHIAFGPNTKLLTVVILILIALLVGNGYFEVLGGAPIFQPFFDIFILIIAIVAAGVVGVALRVIITRMAEITIELDAPERPIIQGIIMQVMRDHVQNPRNARETLTGFTLFVSLTNDSTIPTRLGAYELYVDTGSGFVKMRRFRGLSCEDSQIVYGGHELEIPDFNKHLLSNQNEPIEPGIPSEGILLFGGDGKYYGTPVRTYKLTCVDEYGRRHEIRSNSKDFKGLGLIVNRFGLMGFFRAARARRIEVQTSGN